MNPSRVVLLLLGLVVTLSACSEPDSLNSPIGIPGAPVIMQLEAGPGRVVAPGDAVTLTWEIEGQPTMLTLEPGVGSVSGNSIKVSPLTTTTYTLTASNTNGAHTAEVTVEVQSSEAPPTSPEDPVPPSEPDTLGEFPQGDWAFEVTSADGEEKGELTSGVISISETFTYGEYKGVYGDVTECFGSAEICTDIAFGGIFRSKTTNVLYMALGTINYGPLFVGKDADGALSQNDDGQPDLQGEGEIQEADPATFVAYFLGE